MAFALAVFLLAGCGGKEEINAPEIKEEGEAAAQDSGDPAGKWNGVVKLGGLAPITGDYAEYGEGFELSFRKAVEEINAAGGVNGCTFEIEIRDTGGDAAKATTIAEAFAEDDEVMALLGGFSSGECKANAQICDSYGILQLSPAAAAPDYAAMSEYFFSIIGRQEEEASVLVRNVMKGRLGAGKAAVICIDNDWGLSLLEDVRAQAARENVELAIETYSPVEKDFSSLIARMQTENPDVLLVIDPGDSAAAVFNQADAAGWEIQHVALGPGTSGQVVKRLTDKNNLLVVSPFFPGSENERLNAWAEWFESEAGTAPAIHSACAYDCVYLIAEAVKNIDGEVTRDALRDALADLPEYEGITGAIKFERDGDIKRNYMVCGLESGEWKILESPE